LLFPPLRFPIFQPRNWVAFAAKLSFECPPTRTHKVAPCDHLERSDGLGNRRINPTPSNRFGHCDGCDIARMHACMNEPTQTSSSAMGTMKFVNAISSPSFGENSTVVGATFDAITVEFCRATLLCEATHARLRWAKHARCSCMCVCIRN
jgi:hypothetical protein